MKIQSKRSEGGFVTLVTLVLLLIMVTLISINGAALLRLRREMKEIENRQIQRVSPGTNQPAIGAQPR
jgi:hypothetical protein